MKLPTCDLIVEKIGYKHYYTSIANEDYGAGQEFYKKETVEQLLEQKQARIYELAEWETLRDPNVLHVNLLRGIPAKLSPEQLLHIAGDKYQFDAARITALEKENAALRACAIKYLTWLGVDKPVQGLEKDIRNPEMLKEV